MALKWEIYQHNVTNFEFLEGALPISKLSGGGHRGHSLSFLFHLDTKAKYLGVVPMERAPHTPTPDSLVLSPIGSGLP